MWTGWWWTGWWGTDWRGSDVKGRSHVAADPFSIQQTAHIFGHHTPWTVLFLSYAPSIDLPVAWNTPGPPNGRPCLVPNSRRSHTLARQMTTIRRWSRDQRRDLAETNSPRTFCGAFSCTVGKGWSWAWPFFSLPCVVLCGVEEGRPLNRILLMTSDALWARQSAWKVGKSWCSILRVVKNTTWKYAKPAYHRAHTS